MKIKKGFVLNEVAGNNIVVGVGKNSDTLGGMLTLNSSGVFIWNFLKKNRTYDEIIKALLDKYDTTEEDAKKGLDIFIKSARELGVLDE